jgi:carboxymethylenebutenolidase
MSEMHRQKTAASSRYAAAVQPISATVQATDQTGLVAEHVKIPTGTDRFPAYFAHPESEGNFPIVLVIHEIFGLHEHIKDIVRRLAKLGYLAIAPELFFRQGDVAGLEDIAQIRKIVSSAPDAQVFADLDATVAWAVREAQGDPQRLGITGFCWGGRTVWLYSAHNPTVKAGVAWYGKLALEKTALQPNCPLDIAKTLTVPVLGLYGDADESIPFSTVEHMLEGLKSGPTSSEIVIYPEAPHAFLADYRPSYRESAARDGWKKMMGWFKANGL